MSQPIWRPSADRIAASNTAAFLKYLKEEQNLEFAGFHDLYRWSVANIPRFWESIWEFAKIKHSESYAGVLSSNEMWGSSWFAGAKLNYAENLLRHRDDRAAIIYWNESGDRGKISHAELYRRVARFAAGLKRAGVKKGDRVAAYIPNIPEAVIGMLATASLGAIWSSCSPDFGQQGVLDRFSQITPKVLIAIDGYRFMGKSISTVDRVAQVINHLPSLERVVIIPILGDAAASSLEKATAWDDFEDRSATELEFVQGDFDQPLYILYSSGTTGKPKCIVHGAGGTLLQHFKEHTLHCDLRPDDVIFYFTTCGWMMWNWLVGALYQGAAILLYDGSPAHPNLAVLWDAADAEQINIFGTSPKYLQTCAHQGLVPRVSHKLEALRAILSTGSPLPEATFDWVYKNVKADLQLSSISGGTDIVSCFMLGSPVLPVYRGEIQTRGLGMKVEVYNDAGKPVVNEVGELVCTAPFPSRPVMFWDDPDGAKYRAAYYEHYPGVWRHGDFIKVNDHGGVIVYGRSDATLNRAGVRIGTAEIYAPVEALDEIADSLVIDHEVDGEVEIVLFVVLKPGCTLTDELKQKIKSEIRSKQSPRHVPSRILAVDAIPRTISGKKVELAVKNAVAGREVTNRDALANPEALRQFENMKL